MCHYVLFQYRLHWCELTDWHATSLPSRSSTMGALLNQWLWWHDGRTHLACLQLAWSFAERDTPPASFRRAAWAFFFKYWSESFCVEHALTRTIFTALRAVYHQFSLVLWVLSERHWTRSDWLRVQKRIVGFMINTAKTTNCIHNTVLSKFASFLNATKSLY